MKARLVGIHKVRVKLASGQKQTYYYAWRGGPRIHAEPDTPAFLAEYVRLTHGRHDAISTGTFAELVVGFQNSPEFTNLRDRTKRDYDDHFKHILDHFADLPLYLAEERGFRAEVKSWHASMSETPRRADMRLAALSRVLSWAVDCEMLTVNKAAGISKMHDGSRRDVIWTPEQIDLFITKAPAPLAQAVMLALWTGQRQGDLIRLTWAAYDGEVIALKQSKGGKRVRVVVSDELKAMLDGMERKAVNILTNGGGLPWTEDGFGGYFRKWRKNLGISGVTFHDLRGTFITVAFNKGYSIQQIAKATGHSERHCERIINDHYLAADLVADVNKYRAKM